MDITRRIKAILTADASQFETAMKKATGAVTDLANASDKADDGGKFSALSKSMRENSAAWDEVSSKALIGGAALAAGLGLAVREAISWESAWAGVQKTVEGTPAQMAEVEESLRGLTQVLPATHEEIAGVAEAAGQLGVARDDLVRFTEVAIGLGESTNLSADQAATGLAQLANVMGTTTREGVEGYSKLGSTLVALGNNGASTEQQILDMSLRIAGAATVVGATEADVLALANAMSSVGIEAELGGGVISRTMLTINSAVSEGGEALTNFANVSGMSAEEFSRRWREDPVAVIGQFVAGLGNVTANGGDAATTLESLGLAGTQNAQVLLRAAGASDILTSSLELGAQSWDENSALADEAGKRYATMESQLQIARNSMRDAAIDAGSVLAPALVEVAGWAASAAQAFTNLPTGLQQGMVGLTGLASAALLFVGGGIKAVRTAQDMSDALQTIGARGPRAAAGVNAAKTGMAGLALAMGAVVAAAVVMDNTIQEIGTEQLTQDLLGAEDAVASFNATLAEMAVESKSMDSEIRSLGDALTYALDPPKIGQIQNALGSLVSVFGVENTSDIQIAKERLSELDATLAGLVSSGNGDQAATLFAQFAEGAEAAGYSTEQLNSVLPAYAEAQAGAANSTELAAGATQGWAEQAAAAEEAAAATAEEIRGLAEAILAEYDAAIGASDANIALAAAYDEMTAAVKENTGAVTDGGEAFDLTSEKGRAAQSMLNDYAGQALATAEANLENGASVEEVGKQLDDSRSKFVTAATNMGLNKAAAEAMADGFGLASGTAVDLKDKIGQLPAEKKLKFTAIDNASNTISYIKRGIDGLQDKTVTVRVVRQGDTGGGLTLADGGVLDKTRLGLVRAFADGGTFAGSIGNAQPQVRAYSGPRGILWSEEGSGPWEAFISGHPGKRSRSRSIADEVVQRLGGRIDWVSAYANGGIRETSVTNYYAAAPAPASTTGGSMRISGTLDLGGGVMGRVIGAVEMVEDFAGNAPMRSRMASGVR